MKPAFLLALACAAAFAQLPRERRSFDDAWRFHLGDVASAEGPAVDDSSRCAARLTHLVMRATTM